MGLEGIGGQPCAETKTRAQVLNHLGINFTTSSLEGPNDVVRSIYGLIAHKGSICSLLLYEFFKLIHRWLINLELCTLLVDLIKLGAKGLKTLIKPARSQTNLTLARVLR